MNRVTMRVGAIPDEKIVSTYAEIEAAHGGPRKADPKGVLREAAALLGVTYERARDVMLGEWGAQG